MDTGKFAEIAAAVRAWPADQRLALMQEIVDSLRTQPRTGARTTLDRATGLLKGSRPAPTDEECERIIEEARLAKYSS